MRNLDLKPSRPSSLCPSRALEWDLLRAVALLAMMAQHLAYDLRYLWHLPYGAFIESSLFLQFIQPLIVTAFVLTAGYCQRFSRRPLRRLLTLGLAALSLNVVTIVADRLGMSGGAIYFNVLHLLWLAQLLFLVLKKIFPERLFQALLLAAVLTLLTSLYVPRLAPQSFNLWGFIWGYPLLSYPSMLDYLPLLPQLTVFLLGAAWGVREDQQGRGPRVRALSPFWQPLLYLGQHSLPVYLGHQPIFLLLLSLLLGLPRI